MPVPAPFGALIFVKDLPRMAQFYADLLSLREVLADADHTVLESAHGQLVVHRIPQTIAETFTIEIPPLVREETPIKLFFAISSLAQARAAAPALGGSVQDESREWKLGRFTVCDAVDPEGNVLQLRQAQA